MYRRDGICLYVFGGSGAGGVCPTPNLLGVTPLGSALRAVARIIVYFFVVHYSIMGLSNPDVTIER